MDNAIAIIGMAGRFPQAKTLDRFWENLRNGVESIRPVPDADLLAAGVPAAHLSDPGYVRATGLLEDVDLFDAPFFGLSAREASLLDPQHRILLEVAWEALEAAGYDAERIERPVGLYAGASVNSYFLYYLFAREHLYSPDGAQLFMGNDNNFLATRTSYKLGLRGPSLTVQTACSTSLVAVHLGCQSLLNGECDMALAGGVSVRVPQVGYIYRPGGILSPDGHCRAFDAAAGGSVMGSGVGMVVLKRLEDALADRDPIRAVILGSAVNNDGAFRIGYTAPSVEGQSAAIAEALAIAQVEPETISYVEAHGSGTSLGDPIELAALNRVFGESDRPGSCAIGSVKTNIGHLDAAAGVAGLIKTVLALEHEEIPPSLHFTAPNPAADFPSSAFAVSAKLQPWKANGEPRRAGVSSFGMGGTNAHMVLQEAPPAEPSGASRPWQLLLLSAATPAALEAATDGLAAHLETHPEEPLGDVAYTLSVGRKVMRHRRALVVRDGADAAKTLAAREPGRVLEGVEEKTSRSVAFLLPGLGEHYPGMGRGLYESEPAFREAVDLCCRHLQPILGRDLREVMIPQVEGPGGGKLDLRAMLGRATVPTSELDCTAFAHPALFVTEYALAQLWKEWGIEPAALLGYSLGEYTAACLAGVFSLEDALRIVALRAQAIERLPAGAMLAVPLPDAEVVPLLGNDLALAAVNGPEICVVGGPVEAVQALEERLAERGLAMRRLRTSHAFHSPMMQPVADELARLLAGVKLQAPRIPFLSNVTGTWIEPDQAVDPAYWTRHLLSPVRLADGLAELWAERDRVLLEVGPGGGLSSLALQHPSAGGNRVAVPSLPGSHETRPDQAFALGALGRLWLGGAALRWDGFWQREERRRLRLPTYPFERRRYWVEQRIEERPAAGAWAPQQDAAPRTMQDTAVSTTRHSRPALPTPYAAPAGAVEEGLAAIWQELLGVEPIGRHDSFFDLGGHSLLASQLMTRLAERFGAEIPLSALFEAPMIAKLAETVQAAQTEPGTRTPPIVPVERPEEGLPLSFAQERLWFLDRLIPDNPVYHVPLVTRLRGRLLWPVLAASLNEIARRHEVMRTTFTCVDDLPRQVAAPELRLDPPIVDLSALPEPSREAVARRLLDVEMARPFDLARGPLVRALLVRLDPEEHLTLVNLHHIVADGWSLGVLVQELGALYRAFAAGQPSPLPPLPVQYADYAVWQRQWLQGERLEEQIAYWRERLAGAPAVLDLPHDRPRPAIQRFQGAKLPFRLGAEALPGLSGLQRGSQVTLFMVLLAGYQTLLSRLSGQDDLVVGSPVAGRGRREVEGLIGFFINTLALRADLSGDPTFGELLAQVRQVTLEAYAREDLPFERLVGELQTERSLAHSPIYQAVLVLLNTPSSTLELPGVSLEMIDTWVEGTKWDLTISLEERADGLAGYWEYDSDLFDATTVARFAGQFRELLRVAVAEPELRLSQLSALTEPERHQLLREWNPGEAGAAPALCLHERFDAGVPGWADEVAVSWDEGSWTYRELADRAGRLAHHLRGMGVGPEVPVALCLERSPETVVSILAVLEAGGAYVPIDPHYPSERQEWVLNDSGAKVLLTTRAVHAPTVETPRGASPSEASAASHLSLSVPAEFPGGPGTTGAASGDAPRGVSTVGGGLIGKTVFLDDLDLAAGPILPPGSSGTGPDHLAYIMYTSGSTGRPKGVMVTHRNLVRLFTATEEQFHFKPGDALTLFHSYAFDVSVWELWGALLHGGRAVVVPHWVSRSPEVFHELLRTQRVTVLNQTPQAFRQLALVDPELEPISSLRAVIFAGEALDFSSLTPWWERYGAERPLLINMHGITETTVFDTYRAVVPADVAKGGSLIGRAISDVSLRVLDRRQQPVAAGVAGELCIGGPGLVRGYLGRPDLTAERFIPDPFSGASGARLYRTGDLVRYRPDGDMDFLGRIDHQVKIRGYRIELGEIEAVLANHPAVAQAVVLARQDGGDKRLVAYIVASGVDDSELREHCRRHLPEPMVPALFMLLESLPLSPTGKVDRRALAARPVERAVSAASYKAPADELENLIAEIWQEVLSIERVGADDNFFDLGGHSLALVQVQRKIKARLARDVSVVDLFRTPTVAALAKYLTDTTAAGIAASTDAAHEGDERAQRRRALRDRRRSSVESETSEVYEHVE